MGVLSYQVSTTGIVPNVTGLGMGMSQQLPVQIYLSTNNTLAEVIVAGFLNKSKQDFQIPYNDGQMALVSTTDEGNVWLTVSVNGANYSLATPSGSGSVALPTVANQIAYATDATGSLAAGGSTRLFNAGGLDAGLSGTAGTLRSYPATAANGYLEFAGTANGGARNVVVTNAAHAQTSTYTIPDVGAATGGLLVTTTPLRAKVVKAAAAAGGAAAQSFSDAFCTSASTVVGNWVTQANAASVLTIAAGNGSFIVTSSADAGVGTFDYTIYKA